jgi:3-oxoacyl-[acyl-carrier protein] reductase
MSLTGKNVLVTGASQGLGAAIAAMFAAEGCLTFVNYASSSAKAETVVAEIMAAGGRAEAFQCDMSNETEVNAKIAALEARHGGIDILINNARLDPYKRPESASDGEWWDRTIAVNLKGAYLPTLAVLEGMKSRGWGRIVNVSSVWAYWPARRKMIPYSVSKAGMHALTRAFAMEAAPFNVTVNTVAPGLIMTENVASRLTEEQLSRETATVPLGRGATPEEIARVILNTVNSGFITGETINANGGACMGN